MEKAAKPRLGKKPTGRPTVGVTGIFLLVFAASGWLILIANMFNLAGRAGWIFPLVDDIPGLAASTLLLAVLGLAPLALRQIFAKKGSAE